MSCANALFPRTPCSGDITVLKLTFKDKVTGDPLNLEGAIVGITVKIAPSDEPDTSAAFMKDIPGDATGIINFYIDPLEVGTYWFDVKMWQSDGLRSTIIEPTKFSVIQSVTARQLGTAR